jgi:hypothetical protein
LVLLAITCAANLLMWVISYPIIHLYTKNLHYQILNDHNEQ